MSSLVSSSTGFSLIGFVSVLHTIWDIKHHVSVMFVCAYMRVCTYTEAFSDWLAVDF